MAVPLFPIISSVQSKEAPDRPCYGVSQTCPDVLRRRFRGFCTVFGFSLLGRVGVYSGISQWYRVGDAGALRAKPLATLCLARSKEVHPYSVAGARHVPVGRTVLVESVCRQGGTHSGTVPTGRGSKGVAPQRGWHSSQRPHLRKVGHGSTRNFLANTRAPPSLRRARCGRTSNFVIVPRRAA